MVVPKGGHTIVELKDGLLEVSNTSVDELCTLTTCTAGKIVSLHTRNLESSARGIDGGSRASRSTTNDQEIEDVVPVLLVLVFTQDRAGLGSAFSGSVDVAAGSPEVLEHLRPGRG